MSLGERFAPILDPRGAEALWMLLPGEMGGPIDELANPMSTRSLIM